MLIIIVFKLIPPIQLKANTYDANSSQAWSDASFFLSETSMPFLPFPVWSHGTINHTSIMHTKLFYNLSPSNVYLISSWMHERDFFSVEEAE